MDLISQLLLLSFVFTVGYGVIVAQTFALNRVFKRLAGHYSPAWALLAVAFGLGGALRVWSFVRLPVAILKAQTEGKLPPSITLEQWITIGVSIIVIVLLILAFDRHRRDLWKLTDL